MSCNYTKPRFKLILAWVLFFVLLFFCYFGFLTTFAEDISSTSITKEDVEILNAYYVKINSMNEFIVIYKPEFHGQTFKLLTWEEASFLTREDYNARLTVANEVLENYKGILESYTAVSKRVSNSGVNFIPVRYGVKITTGFSFSYFLIEVSPNGGLSFTVVFEFGKND